MPQDPINLLNRLAESCTRAEDAGYWILMSAANYLQVWKTFGKDLRHTNDGEGSTAAAFYWNRLFPCPMERK
jgi:hypothetical protein